MSDLLTRAKEIKNATEIGENTAERVGGVMVDMVMSIMSAEESLTAQDAQIDELKKRNNAEIPAYTGVVESATIKSGSVTQYSGVHFIKSEGRFAAKQGSEYFANWLAYGGYQAQPVYHQDNKAVPNRLYNLIALSGGGLHYFDGTSFKMVNDNAGVEQAINAHEEAITKINADIVQMDDNILRHGEGIENLQKEVATKQQELTLTVLDNGNIRIGNLQGQTKDFMPATPSGDPMHYAYEAMGAVYNSGADVIARTPWASLVDDADYNAKWGLNLIPDNATFVKTLKYNGVDREVWQMKHPNKNMQIWVVAEYASDGTKIWDDTLVVKRSGMWYMNGLGDLTNQHMSMIMLDGRPETSVGSGALNKGRILRQTNGLINTTLPDYYAYFNQNFEVIVLGLQVTTPNGVFGFDVGSTRCFVHAANGFISIRQPFVGSKLSCGFFAFLYSLNFNAEVISARSIIYALNKTTGTVTITFPSALYDRFMDISTTLGAELVALLESKSNITFARGE